MTIVRLRILAIAVLAFGLGAFVLATGNADAEAPSRDFKNANVSWTLPDGWEFQELNDAQKSGGHLIAAIAPTRDIHVTAYSAATDLPASDRINELKQALNTFFPAGYKDQKVVTSTLSGLSCSVVVAEGSFGAGRPGHLRLYVLEQGGRLYHLEMRMYDNAHLDRADDVNAVRKGFRLLKGAKGTDKDEKFDELGGKRLAEKGGDDDEDETDGADPDAEGSNEDWPAKGPKREGEKLIFTGLNVEWTLEGTGLTWDEPIDDLAKAFEKRADGVVSYRSIVVVRGRIERKKQEFEKNTPNHNVLFGQFAVFPLPGARDTDEVLRGSRLQDRIKRRFQLGEIRASKTRVNTEVTIGSLVGKGGYLQLESDRRGSPVSIMYFEVQLQGWLYQWQFLLSGHTDRFKVFAPIVGKMLKNNVKFPDDKEYVAGPIVPPDGVLTFSGNRGEHLGKERTLRAPGGIEFTKPEEFASLEARGNQAIRFAVEARNEEKDAYIYYDIHTFPAKMINQPDMSLETMADKRIGAWRSGAGENAKLSKSGKPPYVKKGGRLTKIRGKLKYHLEAEINGVPYVEEGIWGKEGQYVVWERVQYGGKDAEKKMKKHWKAIKKGMRVK